MNKASLEVYEPKLYTLVYNQMYLLSINNVYHSRTYISGHHTIIVVSKSTSQSINVHAYLEHRCSQPHQPLGKGNTPSVSQQLSSR